jgi:plastocyanin
MRKIAQGALLGAVAVVLAAGCGGGSSSSSPGSPCPSNEVIHIQATGFSLHYFCLSNPGAVTFDNADTVAHTVQTSASAPCTQLNLPVIAAGASSASVQFTLAGSCSYVDADHAGDPAFIGTVVVGSAPGGPSH